MTGRFDWSWSTGRGHGQKCNDNKTVFMVAVFVLVVFIVVFLVVVVFVVVVFDVVVFVVVVVDLHKQHWIR